MTVHRFYVPALPARDGLVPLPPDEARHLTRVLRLRPGAAIQVFDGRGWEQRAEVVDAAAGRVTVRLGAAVAAAREPGVAVTLAVAILKGRKLDNIVRDATMLGVRSIQPLVTERTEHPAARESTRAVERWRKIAVASAKQSGRAVVPDVRGAVPFTAFIDTRPRVDDRRILLIEPAAAAGDERPSSLHALAPYPPPASAAIAVGPEGGWTAEETARAAASGFERLTLGVRTLRADAAPVAALTVLQFVWGDL